MGQKRLIKMNMLGGGALGVLAMAAAIAAFLPPPAVKHPDDYRPGVRPYRPRVRGVHAIARKKHTTTKHNHGGCGGARAHGSDETLNRSRGLGVRWRP